MEEVLARTTFVTSGEGGEALTIELTGALKGERDVESIAGLPFKSGRIRSAREA